MLKNTEYYNAIRMPNARGMLFVGCPLSPRVHNHILKVCRWWTFHQIYNFAAVWSRDELIRFRGRKVKGQGHRNIFQKFSGSTPINSSLWETI